MQYTDNYQFREPTPAVDIVKVGDINYNSRKIDELIHSTQVSLAPAYDETRTSSNPYMTGDVVMKDALMYRCLDDDVYGAWDATKWERTTAGEEGAGGSDIEPNPQGTPTDDLDTIGINGTIYNIAGSGGGGDNVYGAFIDTNRVIKANTTFNSDTSYTATEDCAVVYSIAVNTGTNGQIFVDGKEINAFYSGNGIMQPTDTLYLKAGQTVSFKPTYSSGTSSYTVYGLTFGTQNIFTPQIYSTEERCVGVWTDNKPLYQKTFIVENISISNTYAIDVSALDVDFGMGSKDNSFYFVSGLIRQDMNVMYESGTPNTLYIVTPVSRNVQKGFFTMIYTKTTDTAGSGSYNTLGVPMMHYSTDEQVVGTWIDGKPLYQKVMYSVTQVQLIDSAWTNIPWVEEPTNIDLLIDAKLTNNVPNNSNNIRFSVVSGRICGASAKTGNFPPTSDPVYVVFQYTKITD